jgi:hypothetical protein
LSAIDEAPQSPACKVDNKGSIANDRAAGRAAARQVAELLLSNLGLDADDPSLSDRAMESRAQIWGHEDWPYVPDDDRAEDLYHAWDEAFWRTFRAACRDWKKRGRDDQPQPPASDKGGSVLPRLARPARKSLRAQPQRAGRVAVAVAVAETDDARTAGDQDPSVR